MKKQPISPVEAIFLKRTQNIYGDMKRRAKKEFKEVPFTISGFREWLNSTFDTGAASSGVVRCAYSGIMLTIEQLEIDHQTPTSRGGSFDFGNLAVCSKEENLRKGMLTAFEYSCLGGVINTFPHEIAQSIWRSLQVGDVQRFAHFRRMNKKRKS